MKKPLVTDLYEEIEFWKSLIDNWESSQNEPVHARIKEALALAEYKLQQHSAANKKMTLH